MIFKIWIFLSAALIARTARLDLSLFVSTEMTLQNEAIK